MHTTVSIPHPFYFQVPQDMVVLSTYLKVGITGTGIALGVNEDFRYEENIKAGAADGQIIALGTDGIWEACNKDGKMFGKKRFRDVIRHNAKENATNILGAVYDELDRHTRGLKSEDDITLVVAKVGKR